MKILAFAITGALIVANAPAEAFPIALPGSEGLSVIVASDSEVVATYQGNSASFSNDLYLLQDAFGNPGDDGDLGNHRFLFNNQTSPVGSQVTVGSFTAGTELIFRLYVNNTQLAYFTGPASRNPDGLPHARGRRMAARGESRELRRSVWDTGGCQRLQRPLLSLHQHAQFVGAGTDIRDDAGRGADVRLAPPAAPLIPRHPAWRSEASCRTYGTTPCAYASTRLYIVSRSSGGRPARSTRKRRRVRPPRSKSMRARRL